MEWNVAIVIDKFSSLTKIEFFDIIKVKEKLNDYFNIKTKK